MTVLTQNPSHTPIHRYVGKYKTIQEAINAAVDVMLKMDGGSDGVYFTWHKPRGDEKWAGRLFVWSKKRAEAVGRTDPKKWPENSGHTSGFIERIGVCLSVIVRTLFCMHSARGSMHSPVRCGLPSSPHVDLMPRDLSPSQLSSSSSPPCNTGVSAPPSLASLSAEVPVVVDCGMNVFSRSLCLNAPQVC